MLAHSPPRLGTGTWGRGEAARGTRPCLGRLAPGRGLEEQELSFPPPPHPSTCPHADTMPTRRWSCCKPPFFREASGGPLALTRDTSS